MHQCNDSFSIVTSVYLAICVGIEILVGYLERAFLIRNNVYVAIVPEMWKVLV